jgi:hypothetical protein
MNTEIPTTGIRNARWDARPVRSEEDGAELNDADRHPRGTARQMPPAFPRWDAPAASARTGSVFASCVERLRSVTDWVGSGTYPARPGRPDAAFRDMLAVGCRHGACL